jgi:hypothetical protein
MGPLFRSLPTTIMSSARIARNSDSSPSFQPVAPGKKSLAGNIWRACMYGSNTGIFAVRHIFAMMRMT